MSKFIYIEDRDLETGHGWRDQPIEHLHFKFSLGNVDRDLKVGIDRHTLSFAMCSYFWICSKEYYEEHGHIEDNVRTADVKTEHSGFLGNDDMESHFEFKMNPEEARAHLHSLGIMCGDSEKVSLQQENKRLKAELEKAKQKEEARKCPRCNGDPCFCQK